MALERSKHRGLRGKGATQTEPLSAAVFTLRIDEAAPDKA